MPKDRFPERTKPKSALTLREEGFIRARLANSLETRLRLGLPSVIGRADGTPVTIYPGPEADAILAGKPLKPDPDS